MRRLWSDSLIVVLAATSAAVIGSFIPGTWAGACGFGIGWLGLAFFQSRRPRTVKTIAPWEPDPLSVGLHLSVYQLRDGSWRPEYVHRPTLLDPITAVQCLRQAADTIEDDWR